MLTGEIAKNVRGDLELDDIVSKDRWNAIFGLRCGGDRHARAASWNDMIELGVLNPTNGHRTVCRVNFDRLYEIMDPHCAPIAPKAKRSVRSEAGARAEDELDEIRTDERMKSLLNAKAVN